MSQYKAGEVPAPPLGAAGAAGGIPEAQSHAGTSRLVLEGASSDVIDNMYAALSTGRESGLNEGACERDRDVRPEKTVALAVATASAAPVPEPAGNDADDGQRRSKTSPVLTEQRYRYPEIGSQLCACSRISNNNTQHK